MTATLDQRLPDPDGDAALVARSVAGDREAFARLVARHQRTVCAVAYSATRSLALSEDIAQETFLAAWRQLRDLREPSRLRAWLCGIARQLAANLARRASNEPLHGAHGMDAVAETVDDDDTPPPDLAIRAEEHALIGRALARVPVLYRDPLVLFYREQQSVEEVSAALELNEATVRQRLARGRRLLQDQVLALVEGALSRSGPGEAFTLAVMAALPAWSVPSAAGAIATGAAHTGAAAKTGLSIALLASIFGPVVSFVSGFFAVRASLDATRTVRERAITARGVRLIVGGALLFTALLLVLIFGAKALVRYPVAFFSAGVVVPLAFAAWFAWTIHTATSAQRRLRVTEERAHGFADTATALRSKQFRGGYREYRSTATLFGLPLVHARFGVPPVDAGWARGWIAVGDRAIGALVAFGGVAVAPISVGAVAVGGLAIGTVSLALLPLAAVAIGGYALGSASLGWFAVGGFAIGWHAAGGGVALAREFAGGGVALAAHANDPAAAQALAALMPPWVFLSLLAVIAVGAIVPAIWYARRIRQLARPPQE